MAVTPSYSPDLELECVIPFTDCQEICPLFYVTQPNVPHLTRLQQRTWLIHWSLFVYFNHPKGQEEIINLFLFTQEWVNALKYSYISLGISLFFVPYTQTSFSSSYLNAIQTCCPHIFRYLTASVITSKKRQTLLKDLVRIIKHVSHVHYLSFVHLTFLLYRNLTLIEIRSLSLWNASMSSLILTWLSKSWQNVKK